MPSCSQKWKKARGHKVLQLRHHPSQSDGWCHSPVDGPEWMWVQGLRFGAPVYTYSFQSKGDAERAPGSKPEVDRLLPQMEVSCFKHRLVFFIKKKEKIKYRDVF